MVGLGFIIYFVLVGLWTIYELDRAPHLDDNGNEIKKTKNF